MYKLIQILTEAKKNEIITIYHGDNYGTTDINSNYKNMFNKNTNVQEGIGVYFSKDIEVAKGYGSHIISTVINTSKLLPSRDSIGSYISNSTLSKFISELNKSIPEFYLIFTDYGIEVESSAEVNINHINKLVAMMNTSEVRNFQIEIIEACNRGVSNCINNKIFVDTWLKHIKYYGTINEQLEFIALMHTDNEVKLINGKENI